MAEMEITAEEISGIDTNQVAQMTLKDGTVIMINHPQEEQAQEEEFVQEEQAQEEQIQEGQAQEIAEAENVEGQENQLRARPMMMPPVRPIAVPMRPMVPPVRPIVAPVPMRPIHPKPLIHPRGPMRPMVPVAPVFRTRPGMHMRPPVVPPKVVPMVPVHKPVYAPVPIKPIHKQAVMPVPVPVHRPGIIPPKSGLVRPMPVPTRPVHAFRARPEVEQEEEEADYQEEEIAGEEEYAEYDQEQDYPVDDLRYRPMMAPMLPPPRRMPMRPMMPPMMPRRRGPMGLGYNTFQPRIFRGRPRPRMVPTPMLSPLNATFQPRMYGYGMRGPRYAPMPPMKHHYFRGKETAQTEECQEQCVEEQKVTKNVCTKCGKEF